MDAGDALVRVVLGMLVEEDGLTRFDEVVELVGGPAREFVDDVAAPGPTEQMRPVEQPGHRVHQVDVRLERRTDARALDLDRDLLATVKDRPVDLADRRGRERLRAERLEDRLGLAAELAPDDLADPFVRERRDLIEQLEQLVAVGGRAAGRSAGRASGPT